MDSLSLKRSLPVIAQNAGLFISRGVGTHARRVIDSHEMIVVRSGTLHIREGNQKFAVGAGDALLLFPGRVHVGVAPYAPELSFYWMHFTLRESSDRGTDAEPGLMTIPQYVRLRRPEVVYELFQRLLNDQETDELTPDSAALLTLLMLTELAAEASAPRSPAADALVGRAEKAIRQRFAQPVSLNDIAADVGCNPDYLGRVYRAACGQTLVDALNETRIRESCRLLRETSHDMNYIARVCGFATHNYFCRVFKSRRGMTPMAYRRLHARSHVITS